MASSSTTPLTKKLGIQADMSITLLLAPEQYESSLQPLPNNVLISDSLHTNSLFIQFFTRSQEALKEAFPTLKQSLSKNGMLWISWPKGTCGVGLTNLNEHMVRTIGLENGLVDVKIISIDDEWSALKFVYRLKDRN